MRATEYKSQFVPSGSTSASKLSAAGASSKFNLRRPPSDFIPATVVAIPTAYTHQHPKPSSYSRSVYSVLNTPNVSTVYGDEATSRSRSSKTTAERSRLTATLARDKRALEQSVEVVTARNRELELQLLDLKRELTMTKVSAARRPASAARGRTSSSHGGAAARTHGSPGQLQIPTSGRKPENLEKTLVLLESLRSAILSRQAEGERVQEYSQRSSSRQGGVESAAMLASQPAGEKRKKRRKKVRRDASAVDELRLANGAYAQPQHQQQQSSTVSIPTALSAISRRSQYVDLADIAPANAAGDDAEASFDTIQKNYWVHSRSMLSQLDRMLADVIHTKRN